jgi:hypothetical protein
MLVPFQTMLPTILHYFPAGSSIKAWRHYGQLISSGKERTSQVTSMLCDPPPLIYHLHTTFQVTAIKLLDLQQTDHQRADTDAHRYIAVVYDVPTRLSANPLLLIMII